MHDQSQSSMKGLGVWLLPDKRTIPNASRSIRSKGKSSPLQKPPASKGRSVADCYDQTSLVEFASSKDPAMVSTVETPSASRTTGDSGVLQWTEARSHRRNDVPVKRGKACDNPKDSSVLDTGDSGREKGGTQKFLPVHSQL